MVMFPNPDGENKQMIKKPPQVLDDRKKSVLMAYQQNHIIETFDSLDEDEKTELLHSLDLIHFDFVDLVFHNLVMKSTLSTPRSSIGVNQELRSIQEADFIRHDPNREDFESTLKMISQGKLAIVISAGLSRKFGFECAKLKIRPNWDSEFSLLQLIIERAREIGATAIYRFGKGYNRKREPIQIYVMINTSEIEEIKHFLERVKNFGYNGLLTFGQDCLPYVNDQGKMCFEDGSRSRIRLVTNGSGAFLSALKSQSLIDHMKNSGIEIAQMINLNNLMVPLAEPSLIKATETSDIVIQVSEHDPDSEDQFPLILFDKSTQRYEYLNKTEVAKCLKEQSVKRIEYELKTLNLYTTVKFLEKASKSAEVLCHYRIKDHIMRERLTPAKPAEDSSFIRETENLYSFELHFLNALRIASNVKFSLIPQHMEAIALHRQDYSPLNKFTLKEAVATLFKNIPKVIKNWIPYDYQSQLEGMSKQKLLKLFTIAGFCFNESSFKKFIEETQKK